MRNEPRLDRVFGFAKWAVLGCLLLLLTGKISAQNEDLSFDNTFPLNEDKTNSNNDGASILRTPEIVKKEVKDLDENDNVVKKQVTLSEDSPQAERYAPCSADSEPNYVITEERLKEIRSQFMYWYFDKGYDGNEMGDYQKEIKPSMCQIHKDFNFELPFYGFRYNYTRVSVNGYLEFSDPPSHYMYPLVFPVKDWPKKNDPSFIGIFFSKCRIGKLRKDDIDQRLPGVYFRMERDLQSRKDKFGVEMRERVKWDIREGIIGAESFDPKHAAIVTWKNISFAGGVDRALYRTNTFQMVLVTDEVSTYVIFNYLNIQWTSHTESGGDTINGEGGVPAFIGFNAGNGTQSYEYMPYSQMTKIRDITSRGCANGFPGRHMFRIDEKIMKGTCNEDSCKARTTKE